MNVFAVNSSARPEGQSKTRLMMDHLVQGMREAGAQVDAVDLREKRVRACIGCFTCWTKTPGKCIHRDDMSKELYPRLLEADLVVYATPLFHHTVNATMKAFIERTLPILEPFLEQRDGRWRHPTRKPLPGAVVLSVAGFPCLSAFDAMKHYVNYLFDGKGGGLWAEIYRPAAEAMRRHPGKMEEILAATREAGGQLVSTRSVRPETLERIQQPIIDDLAAFTDVANCMWKSCMAEGVIPEDARQKGLVPRPDSVRTFLSLMKMGLDGKARGARPMTLQFEFSGAVEGTCHVRLDGQEVQADARAAEEPDVVIRAPFDVWMDIVTGKSDGAAMLLEGKYEVDGDADLLIRMGNLMAPSS